MTEVVSVLLNTNQVDINQRHAQLACPLSPTLSGKHVIASRMWRREIQTRSLLKWLLRGEKKTVEKGRRILGVFYSENSK